MLQHARQLCMLLYQPLMAHVLIASCLAVMQAVAKLELSAGFCKQYKTGLALQQAASQEATATG